MRKKTEAPTSNFENSDKLSLKLLGSTEVRLGSDLLSSFGSRKAQALLYYLATIDGVCTRDTAAGLLWPEMSEKKAKSNLRVAIASVKQHIGAHLDVSSTGLAFNRKLPYESDVETFRNSLAVALRQRNLEAIQEANALYKGEFLQGFHLHNAAPFEEWLVQQREHLRMLAIQGLESLGAFCLDQKAYATGLAAARQLLMLEPWHENAHRQIMLLLALSNQRAAALAHFEVCQRQLRDELDVAPAPETVALYESIKAGDFEQPAAPLLRRAAEMLRVRDEAPPAEPAPPQPPLPPNNIADPLAGFVGRTSELAFACQQLTEFESRLLTILGPGGMGKSSLAQQVAQHLLHAHAGHFPHGIFMVSLLGANTNADPNGAGDIILMAIAEAIGAELRSDAPYLAQLIASLRDRRSLIILDNLEHLIAGAQTIAQLLAQAPRVRMLITSRTRLRVNGETTLVLGKLSLPSAPNALERFVDGSHLVTKPAETWQGSDAVAMFIQRAQVMNPQFTVDPPTLAAIVQICTLVDGLPLGIELAVSWLHALNCAQIAREIERSLDFLTTDLLSLPLPQRTLRSVFERSWQLLAPADQELLAKLTIFPFTFYPDAAQFVAGASLPMLAKLVSHSLLSVNSASAYFMHRSVREFALSKLSAQPDQYTSLQRQFAHYYLDFMAQRESAIKSPQYAVALEQISLEIDNVRMAWDWAITHEMFDELLVSVEGMSIYFEQRGLFREGIERFGHAIAVAEKSAANMGEAIQEEAALKCRLLAGRLYAVIGWYYARMGKGAQAEQPLQTSLIVLQNGGQEAENASAYTFFNRGLVLASYAPLRAMEALEKSIVLLTHLGDRWRLSIAWSTLGSSYLVTGSYPRADACCREGERLAQKQGGPYGMDVALQILGRIAIARGRYQMADEYFQASYEFAHRGQLKPNLTWALYWQGEICRLRSQPEQARHFYNRCIELSKAVSHTPAYASALWGLGCLAESEHKYAAAKEHFLRSQALLAPDRWVHLQPTLGWAILGLGEKAQARGYFTAVASKAEAVGILPTLLDARLGLAYIEHRSDALHELERAMQAVRKHSATTQETRDRIDKIAAELHNSRLAVAHSN